MSDTAQTMKELPPTSAWGITMRDCEGRLNGLSCLVIEEIKEDYTGSLSRISLTTQLDTTRLRMHVNRIHVVEFSEYGCYLGLNFSRHPHYMITPEILKDELEPKCRRFGIAVRRYPRNKTVTSSNMLVCWNFGIGSGPGDQSDETRAVREAIEALNIVGIRREMDLARAAKSTSNSTLIPERHCIRGARQRHYGFSSNYSLGRLNKENGKFVCPILIEKK
jgi:hypothetical protein